MDVREKLVELLQDANKPVWRWFQDNMAMMQLADYLISNGVTVQEDCKECAEATQNCIVKLQEQIAELRSAQEWVSVKDRLPLRPPDRVDEQGRSWFTPDIDCIVYMARMFLPLITVSKTNAFGMQTPCIH